MKTSSNVAYIARLALTLLAITAIVALALAGINEITAPRIAQAKEEKIQQSIEAVLPGGGTGIDFTDETGIVTAVYASDTGYAVQVAPSGFGGTIEMMVGVDKDGKVLKIDIISHAETPSLGAVAAADNNAGLKFRDQFIGLGGTLAVDKDGGEVDSITSATITSRAVTVGVNAAIACVENMG